MNERIKQLWEDNDTIEVCYPEQGSPVSVSATTLEKFAELIVQECIAQVEQAKNSPFVSLDDAKRMAHFVDVTKKKIGKHFGLGL